MANERETKRRMDAKTKGDRKAIYRRMFAGTEREYFEGPGGKLFWRVPRILPDGSSRFRSGLDDDDTTIYSTSPTSSKAIVTMHASISEDTSGIELGKVRIKSE